MNLTIEPSPEPLVSIALTSFSMSDVLFTLLIILILTASAMFAGAEVAFLSLSKSDKDLLHNTKSRKAIRVQKLIENPKLLLATILVAKNVLNVTFVVMLTNLLLVMLIGTTKPIIIILVSIAICTLFLLFVGETFPKTLAYKNKAVYAQFMVNAVYLFQVLPPFSWITKLLAKSPRVLVHRAKKKGLNISTEVLETVLMLSKDENENQNEYQIIQGVLKFGDSDVKQIMCPRMDVVGLDEKATLDEVMKTIIDAGYSRLPVFRESFDQVIGIIFVKDLLPHLSSKQEFDWKTLMREPFYVTENKKLDVLLKEFQSTKIHIAVVIDEYGGTTGIVTLEDVLEEIVGDIIDEYDIDDSTHLQINSKTFLFEGQTSLIDFYRILNIDGKEFDDIKEDTESIGGFLTQILGRIPKPKETLTVENVKLIVVQADQKRVQKVKAILLT